MHPDKDRDDPILPADRPRTPDGRLAENFRGRQDAARRRLADLDPADRFPIPTSEASRVFAALDETYVAASFLRSRDPVIRRLRAQTRAAASVEVGS